MRLRGCEDLEFARVLAQAAGFCQSEAGRQLLLHAVPDSAPEAVERLLDETSEGIAFWQQTVAAKPLEFSLLPPTAAFLSPVVEGLVPQREEILVLGDFLKVDESARQAFKHLQGEKYPRLGSLAQGFADLSDLTREFKRKFNEEGEVRDSASRELKEVRKDLG